MRQLCKILVILVAVISFSFANNEYKEIGLKKAKGIFYAKSALFLDARPEKLYKKGTIFGSLNLPVKKYKRLKKFLPINKNAKIVTFCNGIKCELSHNLAELLVKDGYKKVMVFSQGYPVWKENRLPLMSLVTNDIKKSQVKYTPTTKPVVINNAKVYLGKDENMIDQFWFANIVLNNIPDNIQLIDIRKKEQFKEGHLPDAINVRWDSKKQTMDTSKLSKNKLNVFYCNTGMQSLEAVQSLDDEIAKNVLYFDANVKCIESKCTVEANDNF